MKIIRVISLLIFGAIGGFYMFEISTSTLLMYILGGTFCGIYWSAE